MKKMILLVLLGVIVAFSSSVLAREVVVPNGDFQTILHPDTLEPCTIADGVYFGIDQMAIKGPAGSVASYVDGTTGTGVLLPGWVVPEGGKTNADVMQGGGWGGPDGSGDMALMCFGSWGGPTFVESAAPLAAPGEDFIYTLSAEVYNNGGPVVLELLVDGVAIAPDAATDPALIANDWVELTRIYNSIPAGDVTIVVGTRDDIGDGWTGNRVSIDNLMLDAAQRPTPADGVTIPVENPLTLSWGNWDPNTDSGATATLVDVWFGTDPNEASATYDMVKIVDAGSDVTSVIVDASAEATYYWKVDSDIGEPNKIEGELWSFTTVDDLAPTVEMITPNQLTWSGEPVTLVADITNDEMSPTMIEWVADPADNAVITDGDTATPTVTITKTPYFDAKIVNAGFEYPDVDDGTYDGSTPTGWTKTANAGICDAAAGAMIDIVSEGEQCAWANPGGTFSTVLGETVQSGATYTLSVDIGHGQWSAGVKYLVQLIALDGENEVVLAEDDNSLSIAAQTWETSVVSCTIDPVADANKVDLPLMIKLANSADSPGGADVEFDNVVLTSDTLFPIKSGVDTVTLTVFVSDGGNLIPATASVEIDVYDDACAMARLAFGADDLNDLNKDCDIDIEDLALQAATWLNDTSIDAPAVSPDQADSPIVVNGEFAMYKPGTGYTVQATFVGDTFVSNGFGDNVATAGDQTMIYGDGTTGSTVDINGWITPADGGAGMTAFAQFWSAGYDTDGTSCLNAFGAWSSQNGNLAQSDAPLDLPVRGAGGVYTLSAMVAGNPEPRTFDLLVDGVKIEPDSLVDPPSSGEWQEISRTYNSMPDGDVTILVGTARPGEGDPALTGQRMRVDNISLDVVVDGNLPSVYAGENMITWTDESVTLSSTVTANATPITEGSLSYLWTAYPADGVVFDSNSIENPTVTITKPAGDMASVRVTLSVSIDGVPGFACDSVTIDVYDNACLAGQASDPDTSYDLGDINEDCNTNLEDFVGIAAAWLVDYSSTGPVDKTEE